ncbi:hypothetical protein AB0L59_05670 [Streptomyces sp. NPDC052109]|uniref:hypothetical protein n=1 Tax=Streptomyces sp. NPDC052109 TaxID=3155527 RepID=UPI00342D9F0A
MQTLTQRYGKKRVWTVIGCAWAVIILVGVVKSTTDDSGLPSCASSLADPSAPMTRSDLALCDDKIDNWCQKQHPNDSYCSISVYETGEYDPNWINHAPRGAAGG